MSSLFYVNRFHTFKEQANTSILFEMETSAAIMKEVIHNQVTFFQTQTTKDISFRIQQLKTLKKAILKYQTEIEQALWQDLKKSPQEAYLTEISLVISEIDFQIKHIKQFSKPQQIASPLSLFPSRSELHTEPLGVVLIIAPWNYPFQLLLSPLVGAISAGCCAILKPAPETPAINAIMAQIIQGSFKENYVCMIQGGIETSTSLLKEKFDKIFFTGSTAVGKIVMRAAAENLTPLVLELGGKSPCIVTKEANISVAAKRIVWGKFINAGQTCIAPDYVFVHASVKDQLLSKMKECIEQFYTHSPEKSPFYSRIIHEKHFNRLALLLQNENIYTGGNTDLSTLYIAPTIVSDVTLNSPLMEEELFGPILPILSYTDLNEPIDYIQHKEKPLAIYYFGKESNSKHVLSKVSSGGVCINDTLIHIANHHLPFGGVGASGMGHYHGHYSFLAFSHQKSVVRTPTWIDLPLKYPPFKYFKWIKKIM